MLFGFPVIPRLSLTIHSFIWISFEFVDSFFIRHSDFVIQSLKSRSAFKRNWRAFKPLATPNRGASLSRARSARDHS